MSDKDYEELMMQALDGAISPADRARLDAYLAQRPDERRAFERMLAVDAVLHQTPVASPPSDFASGVMSRARSVPIAKPVKRRYLAAFIITNSVLAALVWLFAFALLFVLMTAVLQQPLVQPIVAFARGVNIYIAEAFNLFTLIMRSLITQPVVWITALVATAVVVTWISIMARVLAPAQDMRTYARTQP